MANASYTVLREFTDYRYGRRFYPGQIWVGDTALNTQVVDLQTNGVIAADASAATPTPPASTVPYPNRG